MSSWCDGPFFCTLALVSLLRSLRALCALHVSPLTRTRSAALHADGSVTTWGFDRWVVEEWCAADGMLQAAAADCVHAALTCRFGGDSTDQAADLVGGVATIASTGWAFAALKTNGSVVTW